MMVRVIGGSEITDFLETKFGPYPFESNGAIVDDHPAAGLPAGEPDPVDLRAVPGPRGDQVGVAQRAGHRGDGHADPTVDASRTGSGGAAHQAENLAQDKECQRTHHRGLILPAGRCACSEPWS
jgi:hypothetical protein